MLILIHLKNYKCIDKLALEFECMTLKHKNKISKLKCENEFPTNIKIELESEVSSLEDVICNFK